MPLQPRVQRVDLHLLEEVLPAGESPEVVALVAEAVLVVHVHPVRAEPPPLPGPRLGERPGRQVPLRGGLEEVDRHPSPGPEAELQLREVLALRAPAVEVDHHGRLVERLPPRPQGLHPRDPVHLDVAFQQMDQEPPVVRVGEAVEDVVPGLVRLPVQVPGGPRQEVGRHDVAVAVADGDREGLVEVLVAVVVGEAEAVAGGEGAVDGDAQDLLGPRGLRRRDRRGRGDGRRGLLRGGRLGRFLGVRLGGRSRGGRGIVPGPGEGSHRGPGIRCRYEEGTHGQGGRKAGGESPPAKTAASDSSLDRKVPFARHPSHNFLASADAPGYGYCSWLTSWHAPQEFV